MDPVQTVIEALRHLRVDNQDDARKLIASYARRHELTSEQQRQVIDSFPVRRA